MSLDTAWQTLVGFHAHLRLPAEPDKPFLRDLTFHVGESHENVPALPLRERGAFHHEGWDIPTMWAIDANGVCWKDNAHGHALEMTTAQALLAECSNEAVRRRLQRVLGLQVDRPSWVLTALRYGWVPPEGWQDP